MEEVDIPPKKIYKWPLAHEEMLNIIVMKGIQIKTTRRYHFIPTKMTRVKKKTGKITSVGENVEKLERFFIAGGNVKWCSHYRKQSVSSSKS